MAGLCLKNNRVSVFLSQDMSAFYLGAFVCNVM